MHLPLHVGDTIADAASYRAANYAWRLCATDGLPEHVSYERLEHASPDGVSDHTNAIAIASADSGCADLRWDVHCCTARDVRRETRDVLLCRA